MLLSAVTWGAGQICVQNFYANHECSRVCSVPAVDSRVDTKKRKRLNVKSAERKAKEWEYERKREWLVKKSRIFCWDWEKKVRSHLNRKVTQQNGTN